MDLFTVRVPTAEEPVAEWRHSGAASSPRCPGALLRLWANADPDLPLLAEAKAMQVRLASAP